MRVMDFAPLNRSAIGFDRLFDVLQNDRHFAQAENYPPYNVEKTEDDTYRVTLAVAGFAPEDLSITSQPNELVVAGRKARNGGVQYLYHGIAARAFERRFSLADYVKVTGARLDNGLLSIDLVREMPEAMKPRRIEIVCAKRQQQVESKIAA